MVELARAISLHPAVHRVELLTRLIADPKVLASISSYFTEPIDAQHAGFCHETACGRPGV